MTIPGLFGDFKVILTSEGYLLKITLKYSWGNANFSVQTFSRTLRVEDVRAKKDRGHPRQEVGFPAAPVMGRSFLSPGHTAHGSGMSARDSDQNVYVYDVFSSLIIGSVPTTPDLNASAKVSRYK